MRLYTFGSTQKTDGHLKSYDSVVQCMRIVSVQVRLSHLYNAVVFPFFERLPFPFGGGGGGGRGCMMYCEAVHVW